MTTEDELRHELEYIRDTFSQAISHKRSKGGQQVPYHGDFANIGPSTIFEMEQWVKRWNLILKDR
jgi:hypothetical protein